MCRTQDTSASGTNSNEALAELPAQGEELWLLHSIMNPTAIILPVTVPTDINT